MTLPHLGPLVEDMAPADRSEFEPVAPRFTAVGKVAAHYSTGWLDRINGIFDRMERGRIEDRIVMGI
jgi:hypothetical protein